MNAPAGIAGVGLIVPSGTLLSSLRTLPQEARREVRLVESVPAIPGMAANDMRRMSKLTRFSLFAASQAMAASGRGSQGTGLFVGITHGSTAHLLEFHDYLFDYGPDMASPNSFSNGVTNAPLSSVSSAFKLTDGGTTILGYENNGLAVLDYCAQAIAHSEYDACLAGSSEEYAAVVHDAYRACGWHGGEAPAYLPFPRDPGGNRGMGVSEGSAFFVLQTLSSFTNRKPLCRFTPVDLNRYKDGADVVVSGAGGGPQDRFELASLKRLAESNPGKKPSLVFSKPLFGETFGLGSMLSALVACDIVANGADYPSFPLHPQLAGLFAPRQDGPAQSALVVAAGRNGQMSAALFEK
jgi:hypothetical protein